jgi:hypothetical protein
MCRTCLAGERCQTSISLRGEQGAGPTSPCVCHHTAGTTAAILCVAQARPRPPVFPTHACESPSFIITRASRVLQSLKRAVLCAEPPLAACSSPLRDVRPFRACRIVSRCFLGPGRYVTVDEAAGRALFYVMSEAVPSDSPSRKVLRTRTHDCRTDREVGDGCTMRGCRGDLARALAGVVWAHGAGRRRTTTWQARCINVY